MKVFALSAFKGSGKDTLASHLIENFGAVRVSFADPLKDQVSKEYGIDRTSLDDSSLKEAPLLDMPVDPKDGFTKMVSEFMVKEFRSKDGRIPYSYAYLDSRFIGAFKESPILDPVYHTPRSLAILKGSTNRVVKSDFWVQRAIQSIKDTYRMLGAHTFVISDLRYKSEMAQLKEAFGDDLVTVRINRFEKSPSSDPSELDLVGEKHDFEIDNTGTLQETYGQLNTIVANSQELGS